MVKSEMNTCLSGFLVRRVLTDKVPALYRYIIIYIVRRISLRRFPVSCIKSTLATPLESTF